MKKLIIGAISAAMVLVGLMAVPVGAATCPAGTPKEGQNVTSIAQCSMNADSSTPNNLWDTINAIINVMIAVIGIVSVIMMILGGVWFLTSQGDPGKVKKGKDTILYGIIGLIVALLAFAIVNFVLEGVFGSKGTGGGGTGGGGTGAGGTTQITNNEGKN